MAFLRITSPHAHGPLNTQKVMQLVLLAAVPGILVLTYFFGFGTLVNIVVASLFALLFEAAVLKLRDRPLGFYLKDCSALVTAFLLAIAMPPGSPWWLLAVGIFFAIVICKQLYGGMGYNPFNPAMAAYVMLLISFPVQMTQWMAPLGVTESGVLGPIDAVLKCLTFLGASVDAVTAATPLDLLLQQNQGQTVADVWAANPEFGSIAGIGWEWVNIAFLLGGVYLLWRRVYTWHAPVAMLVSLTVMSAIFYDAGSSESGGSPLFHLFSGATMFGAFFIVTDPVTSAVSNKGRLWYGAFIGILLYVIRAWGNYPDAMAFAVLLMNFAAPLIDHYTQPRVYGHASKNVIASLNNDDSKAGGDK